MGSMGLPPALNTVDVPEVEVIPSIPFSLGLAMRIQPL